MGITLQATASKTLFLQTSDSMEFHPLNLMMIVTAYLCFEPCWSACWIQRGPCPDYKGDPTGFICSEWCSLAGFPDLCQFEFPGTNSNCRNARKKKPINFGSGQDFMAFRMGLLN